MKLCAISFLTCVCCPERYRTIPVSLRDEPLTHRNPLYISEKRKIAVTVTLYQNNRDSVVRETGLEPVRCKHTPLKRARLPIPPLSLDALVIVAESVRIVNSFLNLFLLFPGRVTQTEKAPAGSCPRALSCT